MTDKHTHLWAFEQLWRLTALLKNSHLSEKLSKSNRNWYRSTRSWLRDFFGFLTYIMNCAWTGSTKLLKRMRTWRT